MILRNGIRSTFRAKGRSLLFTLLILVLTLALTLGVGTWVYSSTLLEQMDGSYISTALVEYMGQDYPDADTADSDARAAFLELDSDAIAALEGVELWESYCQTLAAVEGYDRNAGDVPYPDHGVLLCTQFTPFMVEGMVPYSAEELPDQRVVVIAEKGIAKMCMSSKRQTDWLELYTISGEQYIRSWAENGEIKQITVSLEQLPEECVLLQPGISSCFHYFLNGKTEWRIPEAFMDRYVPCYYYDEATDTYTGSGKVVDSYTGVCFDALYSRDFDGESLVTLIPDYPGLEVKTKTRYLLHGTYTRSGNKVNNFVLAPFYEGCETEPWLEITEDTEIPEIFQQCADMYATANRYVRLQTSANIAALEEFQQNTLRLQEGRFPEAGEAGVCVVSFDMAQQMGLSLGDPISLSVWDSDPEDRFNLTESREEKQLTVVGITTKNEAYYGCVWASDAERTYEGPLFGYLLGHAVLDNRTARQTADAIAALCPANVRVTLYDQGYSAAAQPLQTMQTTAMAITLAAACSALAVLLLFAYLFVGRQQETVQVLICLGTPKRKIHAWLLSGGVVICGFAAALGAVLGNFGLEHIISLGTEAAQKMYVADQRYSESAIGFMKEASVSGQIPTWPALYAGLAVFIVALLLCTAFLHMAQRQSVAKRGKQRIRVPRGGTSATGRGAWRFAFLSARRGGWRSVVVPVVCLVLALLLGILATISDGWSQQLNALYRDTNIRGTTVSTNGRQNTNLLVSAENVRKLWSSDLLEDIEVSIGWNYWFDQEIPEFGTGEFAMYRRESWIAGQPELIALNGLSAAPEFMHAAAPQVTWLEGWDESFLESREYHAFTSTLEYFEGRRLLRAENEPMVYPCLVSRELLEEQGLSLGDTFRVSYKYKHYVWEHELTAELTVVGSFLQNGSDSNIYVPLSFWSDPDWITGEEDMVPTGDRVTIAFETPYDRDYFFYHTTNYGTCVFTLEDAGGLDEFRDFLQQQNFSQVGKLSSNRTTIVLQDQTFVETVDGLNRYISFSQILFPVLFIVVMLLGFIVSWLMINGRRMEFAILRGLGASRSRVFFSFFLEQLLLCITGCILGCGILYAAVDFRLTQWTAIGIFLCCYLLGSALSVMAIGRTKLMQLLSERE